MNPRCVLVATAMVMMKGQTASGTTCHDVIGSCDSHCNGLLYTCQCHSDGACCGETTNPSTADKCYYDSGECERNCSWPNTCRCWNGACCRMGNPIKAFLVFIAVLHIFTVPYIFAECWQTWWCGGSGGGGGDGGGGGARA